MAYTSDSKPLELTQLTSLATDDTFIVGDTSDSSEVVKYITKANLLTDFGSTFAALSHTHATSDITSGTFADARIAESNVTQHQAALSITESQISDLGTYLTSASISDTVYGAGWNGDTTTAASKNAIYDKIEALDAAKADTSHTHTHADITDYDTELAGKTNTTAFTPTADYHVATKKYVDDNAGGDLWSDVVDADIIPDADGTRDLGNTSTRFAETYTDALNVTNNIVVGGTVDGRDIATDGTKLDGVEANADVTDTANVTSAGAVMDSEVTDLTFVKAVTDGDVSTINTGTSTTAVPTADSLAGSYAGTKGVGVQVFDGATDTATGDGKAYFIVPASIGGMNLVAIKGGVATAGTTGTTDVQIHNITQAADMLSTKLTIDSGETTSETAATAAVIDTANDDVAAGDVIRVDVDAVSTTAAQGLFITLEFRLP